MKIAVVGAGFWTNFQIAGWGEVPGAQVVAICNRTLSRAEQVAANFGLNPYPDFDSMVDAEKPDVIDIITGVETHADYVLRAVQRGIPVICQNPWASIWPKPRGWSRRAKTRTSPCSSTKIGATKPRCNA